MACAEHLQKWSLMKIDECGEIEIQILNRWQMVNKKSNLLYRKNMYDKVMTKLGLKHITLMISISFFRSELSFNPNFVITLSYIFLIRYHKFEYKRIRANVDLYQFKFNFH